jgi:hypothetical protein
MSQEMLACLQPEAIMAINGKQIALAAGCNDSAG